MNEQLELCRKYNAPFLESHIDLKVGVAMSVKSGHTPVHGLRHKPEKGTTGWYIWAGEYSDDPDFFKPLHLKHLSVWRPDIVKYLGLGPGWRFLSAPGYEDVWEDPSLMTV